MILTDQYIEKAIEKGLIAIQGKEIEIGPTSVNVRIGKLYRHKRIPDHRAIDIPYEEFKDKYLEEVPLIDDHWVLNKFHIGETVEKIFLDMDFTTDLTTRSSWARYGINIRQLPDELQDPYSTYSGNIPFLITTYGTSVILRPGDPIGQLTFASPVKFPILDNHLREIIQQEHLIIKRNGKKIDLKDLEFDHGVTLTRDNHIKLYKGGLIDPGKPVDDFFEPIELSEQGIPIHKHQFFISASAEEVRIDPHFLGWVKESDYYNPEPGTYQPTGIVTQKTHPNAPRIDPYPIFEGKITFENSPMHDLILKPGTRLTELMLYSLIAPCKSKYQSKYKGQKKATTSKGHLE